MSAYKHLGRRCDVMDCAAGYTPDLTCASEHHVPGAVVRVVGSLALAITAYLTLFKLLSRPPLSESGAGMSASPSKSMGIQRRAGVGR